MARNLVARLDPSRSGSRDGMLHSAIVQTPNAQLSLGHTLSFGATKRAKWILIGVYGESNSVYSFCSLIVSNILTSCDEWGISTAKDVYCTVAVNDEYSRNIRSGPSGDMEISTRIDLDLNTACAEQPKWGLGTGMRIAPRADGLRTRHLTILKKAAGRDRRADVK